MSLSKNIFKNQRFPSNMFFVMIENQIKKYPENLDGIFIKEEDFDKYELDEKYHRLNIVSKVPCVKLKQ